MGLIACPVAGKKKSADICAAFVAGAPKEAEGVVFYGVDPSNFNVWKKVQREQIPFYYVDNSYFDVVRGTQFRVTRNRLQVDAMQHTSDGKRFAALGLEIKPLQNNRYGHWVLIEQSLSFMQFVDAPDWLHHTLLWAEGTGRPVRMRKWNRDKARAQATLQEDLRGAWGLLTHSSAAAVTALLEGVPAYVAPTHAVARVGLSSDNSVDDRRRAFNALADHQFTLDEMKEGKAWAKLNP
jgi:hypothetical protein